MLGLVVGAREFDEEPHPIEGHCSQVFAEGHRILAAGVFEEHVNDHVEHSGFEDGCPESARIQHECQAAPPLSKILDAAWVEGEKELLHLPPANGVEFLHDLADVFEGDQIVIIPSHN